MAMMRPQRPSGLYEEGMDGFPPRGNPRRGMMPAPAPSAPMPMGGGMDTGTMGGGSMPMPGSAPIDPGGMGMASPVSRIMPDPLRDPQQLQRAALLQLMQMKGGMR